MCTLHYATLGQTRQVRSKEIRVLQICAVLVQELHQFFVGLEWFSFEYGIDQRHYVLQLLVVAVHTNGLLTTPHEVYPHHLATAHKYCILDARITMVVTAAMKHRTKPM